MAVVFLLFIKSQCITDAQNVLHLNQCTHGRIWTLTITTFQRSWRRCKWFDVYQKCLCEVSVCFKLELSVLGLWGVNTLLGCASKTKFFFFASERILSLFWCGELSAQVCPSTSDTLHISTTQRPIMVRPSLFTVRSGLSNTNGVLLFEGLFHSVMDYECRVWILAARTHIWSQWTSRGCP
jgi:hypothetical protein